MFMYRTYLQMFFILCCCLAFDQASFAQGKPVKTENGLITGLQKGSVRSFFGVPFAAPPVGDLRWKAPQPVQNWQGIKACTSFPASAMQADPVPFMMWTEEFIAPPKPLSEDCLYLNVWTAAKSSKEKRPVFVWIHGGGFTSGASTCAVYDGDAMAQKGLVFVSINYRLGAFGFLAHPELSKESGHNASGNYALLDQIATLQWIKKNITAFGGDPNNVTIAGQSAGSFAVNALIASPLAKGLFHRAIPQSGGLFNPGRIKSLPDAEKTGQLFMKNAGVSNLAELRQKSAEEVLKIAATIPWGSFGPVSDEYVLPTDLYTYFKQQKQNQIPILTGWVTGDGNLAAGQNTTAQQFKDNSKKVYGDKLDAFLALFPANSDAEAGKSALKQGLISFAVLSSHVMATTNSKPSFLYQFSHVPVDKPDFPNYGAFHTSEVPFALHTLHLWKRPWRQADYDMEKIMSQYWVNFAKNGDPNGPGLPVWKAYESKTRTILELGDPVVPKPGLFQPEINFMEALVH
jgi:para-nitrobenzyl esterase